MEHKTQVFISHSSKDKPFAWRLVRSLNSYQLPVWFDARELRPGDYLHDSIKDGIKGSDYFVLLLSKNSISSKWVKFELKEAIKTQKLGKDPKVIPVIIKKCRTPRLIKDIYNVDFTKGWAYGLSELLRGILREHQIVRLTINRNRPLQLDTKNFQNWLEENMQNGKPLLFVLDDHGLLNELLKKDRLDVPQVTSDLRYSESLFINFVLLLPSYVEAIRGMELSRNDFFVKTIESFQTLFKLVFYDFYKSGVEYAFCHGLSGNPHNLRSINWDLIDNFDECLSEVCVYKLVGRKTIAALLNITDPVDLDLIGKSGTRNMCHLLLTSISLPKGIEENWQLYELHPLWDISPGTWISLCMPQIGAEHVTTVSHDGNSIVPYIGSIGLKPTDYEKMGPS